MKDLIKDETKQSYTLKVDIEALRKWAEDKYSKVVRERDEVLYDPEYYYKLEGEAYAYGRVVRKLEDIERGGDI